MDMTIHTYEIQTTPPYPVLIGRALLPQAGALIRERVQPCRCLLAADATVDALYGATVAESLAQAGFAVCRYSFPAGEGSKTMAELQRLLEESAARQLGRDGMIVALGGGVSGDLAGLAAALYLRGIRYVQMPTTLLAAVDAAVGGKTAVNLPAGKNLAGAIHQPQMVIGDCDTFSTLPPQIWQAGLGECIKYGMLGSAALLRCLSDGSYQHDIPALVNQCVAIKARFIAADEYDSGERQLLNFGHTIGHAIERCSNYSIAHGLAVATGMAIITRAAVKRNLCSLTTLNALTEALTACDLPLNTNFSAQELAQAALQDKKRRGEYITLVLPQSGSAGGCARYKLPIIELEGFIEEGI